MRRWVTAGAATPVVAAAMAGFGWASSPGPALIALTLGAAVVGGLIVASYVPANGFGVDLGCGPCAVMSGVTVVGSMVAMHTYAGSLLGPIGAALLMTFGLTQRLNQQTSCATPARRAAPDTIDLEAAGELSDRSAGTAS
jgi:hypothetical protein